MDLGIPCQDVLPNDFRLGPRVEYRGAPRSRQYAVGYYLGKGVIENPTDDGDLDYLPTLVHEGVNEAEDGYLDGNAERSFGHLIYCRHHGNGPQECGKA